MTSEERAELRALCERATAGPWEHSPRSSQDHDVHQRGGFELSGVRGMFFKPADAAFVAAARTALPRLLDAIERCEMERDALEQGFLVRANEDWDSVMEYCCQKQKAELRAEVERKGAALRKAKDMEHWHPLGCEFCAGIDAALNPHATPEQGRPSGEAA